MHKNMHYKKIIIDIFAVTFREEGVDWNRFPFSLWLLLYAVTFREEGVDWNGCKLRALKEYLTSPSARKVWIEIIWYFV